METSPTLRAEHGFVGTKCCGGVNYMKLVGMAMTH